MENEDKSTAERVAANVREVRKEKGLDLAELSQRLGELGQPIGVSGLSKLENSTRRIDTADLIALAIALDVTPNRILLARAADDGRLLLTANADASSESAWRWAAGDLPLRYGEDSDVDFDFARVTQFSRENRPHDPPDETQLRAIFPHHKELFLLVDAVQMLEREGITRSAIFAYVDAVLASGGSEADHGVDHED